MYDVMTNDQLAEILATNLELIEKKDIIIIKGNGVVRTFEYGKVPSNVELYKIFFGSNDTTTTGNMRGW